MANQIVVSAGAKVRNLSGVLTATSGVVSFLPIDVSMGIPQLDVNGKILVSQLPNSVMEYKGTWSAATNTPTLANGTGNQGDVYLCNVAGTVDFGAGPIAFFVGDQVIYSGSIWQRASGAIGTVTSVAVTESGDSLNITGSPITTSGTINIGFNGTNLQYVNGAGNLTTFPILTGYVTAVSGTAPVVSSGGTTPAISMAAATSSVDGYLLATDFAIFNAKQSALTFSSPLVNTSGTISIPAATTSVNGYLASADFTTFNNKQNAITLTTTGTSGASTLVGATLNIPQYADQFVGTVTSVAATGGTGISITGSPITTSGTITITNTAPDQTVALTASTGISVTGTYPNFTITNTSPSSGGTVTSVAALTIGTSGTDLSSTVATSTTTPVITLNVPTASATNRGALASADWSTFNSKQGTITLTTTGTSGAATFSSNTLNIPQYQGVLTNPVTGTGTTNYLPKFTGASTIGDSAFYDGGGFGGFNSTGLGSRTFVINAANARPLVLEMIEYANVHAVYVRPNNSGYNLISSNYISGGVYIPLALSGRESSSDLVLWTNGNTSIGQSSDSGYKLDVNGTGRFSSQLFVNYSGSSDTLVVTSSGSANGIGLRNRTGDDYAFFNWRNNSGTELLAEQYLQRTAANTAIMRYTIANGSSPATYLTIASTGAATFSSSVTATQGIFKNSGVPAILAYRDLDVTVVGTAGQGIEFGARNGATNFVSGAAIYGALDNPATTGLMVFQTLTAGSLTTKLTIASTGAATFSSTCTATGFFESSDSRLKTLIQDNYQTKGIASITPKLYTKNGKVELGYYAQDFVGILDSAVSKGEDDMLSLSYREVHTAKIYALEQEIKELKAKMN